MTKLYVGILPFNATEDSVRNEAQDRPRSGGGGNGRR